MLVEQQVVRNAVQPGAESRAVFIRAAMLYHAHPQLVIQLFGFRATATLPCEVTIHRRAIVRVQLLEGRNISLRVCKHQAALPVGAADEIDESHAPSLHQLADKACAVFTRLMNSAR
jgi:hypothetical protein